MSALVYFLVVFTPWAFGTTEEWSMWTANAAAYVLGALWMCQRLSRPNEGLDEGTKGPKDQGTNEISPQPGATSGRASSRVVRAATAAVAVLTVLLLGYVLVSLLNARATYDQQAQTFKYYTCIRWLPHTYDTNYTWPAFWNYLAWALAFWTIRDWVRIEKPSVRHTSSTRSSSLAQFPRLTSLLWVTSINGALLALEALMQRATDTNKLLWFRSTFYNPSADAQFGPFAYRANGAQYLNLVWPVTLGFWWALHRVNRRAGSTSHHVLLPCVGLMIVAPVLSMSRGGAIIAAGLAAACAVVLIMSRMGQRSPVQQWGLAALLLGSLAAGLFLGGEHLSKRMRQYEDSLLEREKLNHLAVRMAQEYPIFGTGAETFQPLYQFYKQTAEGYWPGQLHNDWLETRITFGWVGFGMILAALSAALLRWTGGGGIQVRWTFVSFFWIAMAGCLIHARWDLPFQVYAIVLLFLVWTAVLMTMGRGLTTRSGN